MHSVNGGLISASSVVSNAGINLTSYHPPSTPGLFAPKCMPSPKPFAQQKMPEGQANK